ncbi:MAG: hypothetical protein LQ346_005981 [Caloplaca aetnensis]|nr:MAG: hypothetical protein LQ346_005981 [Caloplaca aetnensis]
MFGIRESGFVISVFANGVAQIPSEVKPEATLFHVEVNMLAELNTVDGQDAAIDVFIQFKPFHYIAKISVSVGCAISIKVWFVRVRISASVGAALHIEGPDPFGGSAHVDFYLFGFTIDFGKRAAPAPGVGLLAFYQMLNTPGPAPAVQTSQADATDPMMARLKFTLTGGLLPQPLAPSESAAPGGPFPDTGASKPWIVKAGKFTFTLESEFAISAAEILQGANDALTPIGSYALEPTRSTQSSFLASPSVYAEESALARWSHFADAWKTSSGNAKHVLGEVEPNGNQAEGLLKMASHWLGWDAPPPGQNQAETGETAPWTLDGAVPSGLLDTLG